MEMNLPSPSIKGEMSVEEAIKRRRSVRYFKKVKLPLLHLSQLLWASQGIIERWRRTSPSAGATYPLDIFAVCKDIESVTPGIYHYLPSKHNIRLIKEGDFSLSLMEACLGQGFVGDASLVLVITAEFTRTTKRYGERGVRYVHIEVGHVGENLYLQAESLGLATCGVGAFYDEKIKKILDLPKNFEPLYIMPFGYPI
ncbi:MAG: SagB/ThcOx family dehydrogenase [bacterium]|nr:SagB/ThcOx family dehydrogenase [bacterium]